MNILPPPRPGEVLRKLLLSDAPTEGRITQDQLASAMGISRISVNQLVNDRRSVTAEMALRLGKVTGTSPEMWLRLQQNVDLYEARLAIADELDRIPTLRSVPADGPIFNDV